MGGGISNFTRDAASDARRAEATVDASLAWNASTRAWRDDCGIGGIERRRYREDEHAERTLRNLWMRPTGNWRPALTEREVGFFVSPPFMVPLAPLPERPLPERPLAPLPDMM